MGWQKGKKQSSESIEKRRIGILKSWRDFPRSPMPQQIREKIAATLRGRKMPDEIRKKISMKERGRTFSMETRHKIRLSKMGSKNNNWKGGVTDLNDKIRALDEYKRWRQNVFERDNFTCCRCGIIRHEIQADHIIPLCILIKYHKITDVLHARNVSSLWDIDNGRTMCFKCHKKTNTYALGAKNINLQFELGLVA